MIRAVFFDFYSVWAPDRLSYYLAAVQQNGPEAYQKQVDLVEQYYHGQVGVEALAEAFRIQLGHTDISVKQFQLQESDISPQIVDFMRSLHGHFLKVGILANLGQQEANLLNNFNQQNEVFETIASPLTLGLPSTLFSKEVFSAALQAIGEPTENCLMVSGNQFYLQFCTVLDLPTLRFGGLPQLQSTLSQLVNTQA